MDHQYIDEHSICDLYVMDRLPAETRDEFESHFMRCEHCVEMVEQAQAFHGALHALGRREAVELLREIPAGPLAWLARSNPWWQGVAIATAILLLLMLPSILFLNKIESLEQELQRARAAARTDDSEATPPRIESEAQQQPAKTPNATPAKPGRASSAHTGGIGRRRPDKSMTPQVNTPVFVMDTMRDAERNQAGQIKELVLDRADRIFVISLELNADTKYKAYRAKIYRDANKNAAPLWRANGLKPDRYDALTLTFRADFFRRGKYLITIEGLGDHGNFVPVAEYPFDIAITGGLLLAPLVRRFDESRLGRQG